MNIAVMGLGYVGTVTAACLACRGHHVTGVDINTQKVATINTGRSPLVEPGLDSLIANAFSKGNLTATDDTTRAVLTSDICMVCVGTPSRVSGGLDLDYVKRVCADIGTALAQTDDYKVIVIRSTVLPDAFTDQLIPALTDASSKQPGVEFGLVMNPEFIREGSAITDFETPPFTVIGSMDFRAGAAVAALYADLDAPVFHTSIEIACMVKYASNAFHALKVTFANEIGRLCDSLNVNPTSVMAIFCEDIKLNISPRYLRPGFAFGGSCLPKDLRALLHAARHHDINLPVLAAVLPSNDQQIALAVDLIEDSNCRSVAILGLSFKPNTDDLRESPLVRLTETLLGKGYDLHIHDEILNLARLTGTNQTYIERTIPHLAGLMHDRLMDAINAAEVIVIGREGVVLDGLSRPDQIIIDLTTMRVSLPARPVHMEVEA
ncbi:MAG: nucleotide sugar dehydrogenase [Chloroflexota bacterium]